MGVNEKPWPGLEMNSPRNRYYHRYGQVEDVLRLYKCVIQLSKTRSGIMQHKQVPPFLFECGFLGYNFANLLIRINGECIISTSLLHFP